MWFARSFRRCRLTCPERAVPPKNGLPPAVGKNIFCKTSKAANLGEVDGQGLNAERLECALFGHC